MSQHEYLMNIASILYIVCYAPELYANYKNKNANAYNIPEKIVMLTATTFALSYSIVTQDQALMLNYGPIFALDITAFLMRLYYMRKGQECDEPSIPSPGSQDSADGEPEKPEPFHP